MNINWTFEILDTIVSLSGKYARWLNIRMIKFCFIIWSFNSIYWAFRDVQVGMYSQAFFCVVSLVFHLYGYFNWKKKEKNVKT